MAEKDDKAPGKAPQEPGEGYQPREENRNTNNSNKLPPSVTPLSVPQEYTTKRPQGAGADNSIPMRIVHVLTLFFVGVYTFITGYAVILSNRAFVYFDHAIFNKAHSLTASPPSPGGPAIFNLPTSMPDVIATRFVLRNEGNTPTAHARVVLACLPVDFRDLQHIAEPYSLFKWNDHVAVSEIIGGKQSLTVGPCEFSCEATLNAQLGIIPIMLMGQIRYSDVIYPWPLSKEHITEFSQRLVVKDFDCKSGRIDATTIAVGKHNCADNDCPP
jgi:hypothetical protein